MTWAYRWLFYLLVHARYYLTGDCGHYCEYATFTRLDGVPERVFVPEAECPIHDRAAWGRGR